jgi:hypothetical protein
MITKPITKTLPHVKIVLTPSSEDYKLIKVNYELSGTSNPYEYPELWDGLVKSYTKTLIVENISIKDAEAIAEGIRMMFPDQHVNLYGSDDSYIGNTTWNDQLNMFWGYPTYTPAGKAVMAKRMAEQAEKGILPSWE